MRLEDEIKQKKFKDEYHKLVVNLIYTGNWAKQVNVVLLKKHNLTSQQFNILRILRGQYPGPASVNLLIDRMLDKMSNASRLVEKLRQKKLVERRENDADRQADVLITKKGLELLEEIDKELEVIDNTFRTITEEEGPRGKRHIGQASRLNSGLNLPTIQFSQSFQYILFHSTRNIRFFNPVELAPHQYLIQFNVAVSNTIHKFIVQLRHHPALPDLENYGLSATPLQIPLKAVSVARL